MNDTDAPQPHHPAETAMDRARTTSRDARDAVTLAALALLGEAVPARLPGARFLHTNGDATPRRVRVTDSDGASVMTSTSSGRGRSSLAALTGRAAAAAAMLNASADHARLVRPSAGDPAAGLSVDLSECARVMRELPAACGYTTVGAWNRPEEIPGCQDREPVDDFIEHVEAANPNDAAKIALERQRQAHLEETAPTEAGYGMEPHAIAVFPVRVWPAAR